MGDALFGQIGRPGLLLGRQFGAVGQHGPHGRRVDLSGRRVQLMEENRGNTIRSLPSTGSEPVFGLRLLPCWTFSASTGRRAMDTDKQTNKRIVTTPASS